MYSCTSLSSKTGVFGGLITPAFSYCAAHKKLSQCCLVLLCLPFFLSECLSIQVHYVLDLQERHPRHIHVHVIMSKWTGRNGGLKSKPGKIYLQYKWFTRKLTPPHATQIHIHLYMYILADSISVSLSALVHS